MADVQAVQEKSSLRKRVQDLLREEDSVSLAGSLGQLLIGAAVCLFMGVVVASVITYVLSALAGDTLIGWMGWYVVYLLALAPWLAWQDRKNRTDYISESLSNVDTYKSSGGEYQMDRARIQVGVIAAFLTWGPRSMLDGINGFRGRRNAHQNQVFHRAAQMVLELAKLDGGVEIQFLVHPPEHMPTFIAASDWLERNNWLGKSSDGERMWLSSTGRKKLVDRNLMPRQNVKVV